MTHRGVLIAIKNTFVSRQILFFGIFYLCVFIPPPPNSSCHSPYAIFSDRYLLFEEIFTLSRSFPSTIVNGDFILPEIDWSDYSATNSDTQNFYDIISCYSFQQIINFPTAASGILDIVQVNPKQKSYLARKLIWTSKCYRIMMQLPNS